MGSAGNEPVRLAGLAHGVGAREGGSSLRFACSLLALLVGIMAVPYLMPPSTVVSSASYEVGFNNALAFALYVVFLALAVITLVPLLPASTVQWPVAPLHGVRWKPPAVIVVVMAAHAALFAALYAVKGAFVFAEANTIQDQMFRMTFGERPWVDFLYTYGPAMIYPPYLLSRRLGIEAGYGLCYVVTYIVGLYALYLVLQWLIPRSVTPWFAVIAVGLFNPYVGLNYTFLRFLLPLLVLVAVDGYLRAGGRGTLFAGATSAALALLYSLDIGLVTVLGSGVTIAVAALRPPPSVGRRVILLRAVTLVATALATLAAVVWFLGLSASELRAYLDTVVTFGGGFSNLPMYPSLPVLVLVAMSVLVFALAAAALARTHAGSALLAGWLAVTLAMERAIFSQPEVAHVAFYGLPLTLLMLAVTTTYSRRSSFRRWSYAALLVGVVLPLQTHHALLFASVLQRLMPVGARAVSPSSSTATRSSLASVVGRFGPQRPYYLYDLEYYGSAVYRKFGLRHIEYCSLKNCPGPNDIDALVRGIDRAKPVIVAPSLALVGAPPSPPVSWRGLVATAFAIVSPGSYTEALLQRNQARLRAPLLAYLRAAYRPVFELHGLTVLLPTAEVAR